jgi:hypothetical protein
MNTGAIVAAIGAAVVLMGLILWLRAPGAANAQRSDVEYRLSHDAVTLAGSREKLFVLERWQKDGNSGAVTNILIVNSDDASSRWMFPDNGQTVLKRDELHGSDAANIWSPVTGLVLTVATGARESLYYYRVGGSPAVRFLTADAIISADQVAADRYLVLIRNGSQVTAAVYSLVDFRVVSTKAAPDVP